MYKILDYSDTEWKDLIKRYNLDIYFTPQYCKVWEEYCDGKSQAFFHESSLGKVLYPYLVRKVSFRELDSDYFDISTPYGYGGPILLEFDKQNLPLLIKDFRLEFATYAHEKKIICEFVRFHPIYKNHKFFLDSDIKCKFVRNTIKMNLALKIEDILKTMNTSTRNNIRKAIKNGLNVVFKVNPTLEDIKVFYKIYSETMNRLETCDFYKFSFNYFLNTFTFLKENSELAFVYKEDNVISSTIFSFGNNIVHYHLGGSLQQYLYLKPNNIMVYEAALKHKTMGKKYLHLGGGYRGNDSLYRFKKGFNKNGVLDFFIGTKIFNEKAYNLLANKWRERNYLGKDFRSDFFPLYRLQINEKERQ